ncbi:mechanosensitive ion channel family protein [Hutsoniella sourekii]|uniref:mechanosensitive ion channel family protein n=1 Tax=Hutsoniella sourekii TaxID=87650 RepID=UPI000482AA9D|nr:mechanosensitive ion channel domain-containing protein [Hutsoniella sourekii]
MQEVLRNWLLYFKEQGPYYWLWGILVFIAIFIVPLVLKRAIRKWIKSERAQALWESVINWLMVFCLIVFILTYFSSTPWFYRPLFSFEGTSISLFFILALIFSIFLTVKFVNFLEEFILPGVYRQFNIEPASQATINSLVKYAILFIAVWFTLGQLGFDTTSITVFTSVLGVGIGFGIRNIMNNFISGIILLFERPIKVGDLIVVDKMVATVEQIRMRATIVRTRKNERLIIPNSYFIEDQLINRSYGNRDLRISIEVGVDYSSDIQLVKKLLLEAVDEVRHDWPNILSHPQPRVFFDSYGDFSLNFSLWVWIDSQKDEREFRIASDLRVSIFNKFNENGVEFPFPRQDIHILNREELV